MSEGKFRSDLFFRLHVIKLNVPSLTGRLEDFDGLLFGFAREMRVRFSEPAIDALKVHRWPGNIRELKNAVCRAAALFPGQTIQPEHVAHLIDHLGSGIGSESGASREAIPALKEIEKDIILQKLIANQGNQRRTALELGIPKSTLHDRIKNYQINIRELAQNKMI